MSLEFPEITCLVYFSFHVKINFFYKEEKIESEDNSGNKYSFAYGEMETF